MNPSMNQVKIPHKENIPWLEERTILMVVCGSHAYGTDRPDSDLDYKGVCVPPSQYREGFLHRFEQSEYTTPIDCVIFDIRKFFKLAADCNPNIIETLWTDSDHICWATTEGAILVANRNYFLSRKATHTFRGYAMSQLKRIKTHRKWLLDPPKGRPQRVDFDLPEKTMIPKDQLAAAEASVRKMVDSWEIDYGDLAKSSIIYIQEQMEKYLTSMTIGLDEKYEAAGKLLGYDTNFLEYLDRERRYGAALRNWKSYAEWHKNRNPARAAMEAKFGYDGKHALHLVRLLRMCREILTDGMVLVRRPDAEELKQFLVGHWSYEKLMDWAEAQDKELLELEKKSPLRKSPDRKVLDAICTSIVRSIHDNWDA